MEFLKKLLKISIPAVLVVVAVNDIGRYLQAQYTLENLTRDAANASAEAYRRSGSDRTQSWKAGEDLAEAKGAVVYGFDVVGDRVHVWTRMPVQGTWLLQRASAIADKKPAETPLNIETDDESVIP